jgi:hypothetical protein
MLWMDGYLADGSNGSLTRFANIVGSKHGFTMQTNLKLVTSDSNQHEPREFRLLMASGVNYVLKTQTERQKRL